MRTFAMTLVGAAQITVAAVLVYFFIRVVLPSLSTDESAVAFVPIFVAFVALFGVFGVASLLWPGARQRARFWLAASVPGVLFLVMFGPEVAFSLGNPAEPSGFVPGLLAVTAAIVVVVGGVIAYIEVRSGATILSSERRARVLVASLGAVLAGAALTSLIAGSTSPGGVTVGQAPTATGLVVAENSAFDRREHLHGDGRDPRAVPCQPRHVRPFVRHRRPGDPHPDAAGLDDVSGDPGGRHR